MILFVAEHASADVPPGIDLGVGADVMRQHVAVDIGVAPLTTELARRFGAEAVLAPWSRLVVDCNRAPDDPSAIPQVSDGIVIPGNRELAPEARAERLALHDGFHASFADAIARNAPRLIVSVHSFTPALMSREEARPWPVAVLWNRDDRGAWPAIEALRARGHLVGVNEPYSGAELNYSLDRHAEAAGIAYTGFEVRQNEIGDHAGVARWADELELAVRAAAEAVGAA
jgi:predicted N-formylglutamate amidohydrolase